MKVGYGITTTPKRFDPGRDYFENALPGSATYLHNDVEGIGGASCKNICIRELYNKGCNYIILMDDDTRILHPEFTDLLIRAYQVTGIHHFTVGGSKTVLTNKQYPRGIKINQHMRGSGVMLFITRKPYLRQERIL